MVSKNASPKGSSLIKSIKELQDLEEYLFSRLEQVNSEDRTNVSEQNDIIDHINELSDLRNNLYKELRDLYVDLDKNSQIERGALTDQLATAQIIEEQLNRLKQDTQGLVDAKTNKLRMVQIGQYEYLRYTSHRDAMKTIAFTSLWILAISLVMKHNYISKRTGAVIITLILSIGLIFLGQKVWDILQRDNMNYNQIEFPAPVSVTSGGGDTVFEHDVHFFRKLWTGMKGEAVQSYDEIKGTADKALSAAQKAEQDLEGTVNKKLDQLDGSKNGKNGSTESFRVVRPAPPHRGQAYAPFN